MGLASQRAVLLRGDPGLFDILKKGLGFVAKQAAGRVPGGRTALSLLGRQTPGPRFPIALPQAPFGGRVPQISPTTAVAVAGTTAGCPKGFHINRSSYHTMAGFVEKGTMCVRNRRRNLSNGRANTRALRRMTAWEKQDKKRRQTLAAIARSAK